MSFDETTALAINTLAHPRRLRLFRLLSIEPEAGRNFKTLMSASGLHSTPLNHHLGVMEKGGLIIRRRRGNSVAFVLTLDRIRAAMAEVDRLQSPERFAPRVA